MTRVERIPQYAEWTVVLVAVVTEQFDAQILGEEVGRGGDGEELD